MALPTEVLLQLNALALAHPKALSSDLILLAHALIVRLHLIVSKNPEKPKKVSVDLTGHTYDGRCKRLVHDAINVLVFVVTRPSRREIGKLEISTSPCLQVPSPVVLTL